MANKNPNPATRFQKGQPAANPGGKPVNARNQITKKFLETLAKDFEANGEITLQLARETDPMGYIRAVASLLPKEFVIERPLEGLSDDELAAAVEALKSGRVSLEGSGNGAGDQTISEPAANVRPI